MTERERYRTRGMYYMLTNDDQQCAKEYGELVARYKADASARNNLALCLTHLRQMDEAVQHMQQVVSILPNRPLYRQNLALFADYAGDFETAEKEAGALADPGVFGTIAIAFAQMGQGQIPQATETYQKLAKIDAQGASYAASGLADIAVYEGRFSDAAHRLEAGAAADLAAKDPDRAAAKFAALAQVQLLRQQKAAALAAVDKALANSQTVKIRFLAARVFVEAGEAAKAQKLGAALSAELQPTSQAYGRIIDGEAALKKKDPRAAIKALTEANTLLDTWIGRFDLGRAYLDAGQFPQADSEFDRCVKRRGEGLALFLDEEPTFGYTPVVYYYQGRVRQGLKSAGFAEPYRKYLDIRGKSTEDPLVPQTRKQIPTQP
jgi:tetratricopeptide (TPR) repeat protein